MKIVPHSDPTLAAQGVKVGETTGVLLAEVTLDSKPSKLNNTKKTKYHWAKVDVKVNKVILKASAIVWRTLLENNPMDYLKDNVIDLTIQLNGAGKGYVQVRLPDGRLDFDEALTDDQRAQLVATALDSTPTEKVGVDDEVTS
tara:strand:+ start:55 stop:483 length:429 start_codon:yes stop_codon:yes gene_type:complete